MSTPGPFLDADASSLAKCQACGAPRRDHWGEHPLVEGRCSGFIPPLRELAPAAAIPVQIRDASQNSLELARNAKGEPSWTVKLYFAGWAEADIIRRVHRIDAALANLFHNNASIDQVLQDHFDMSIPELDARKAE